MLPSPDTNILLVTAVVLAGWAEVPGAGGAAEVPGAGGAAGDMSGRTQPWSKGEGDRTEYNCQLTQTCLLLISCRSESSKYKL